MSTVSQRSAATRHTADQKTSVPFHPHAADILGTSQIERRPPHPVDRLRARMASTALGRPAPAL